MSEFLHNFIPFLLKLNLISGHGWINDEVAVVLTDVRLARIIICLRFLFCMLLGLFSFCSIDKPAATGEIALFFEFSRSRPLPPALRLNILNENFFGYWACCPIW